MLKTPTSNLISLVYVYKSRTEKFWINVLESKSYFNNIFILNFSDELLSIEDKAIKIINFENKSYPDDILSFFSSKKINTNYILLLFDDEKPVINDFSKFLLRLKDNDEFNVFVRPEKYEVYEYDIESFSSTENRLFNIKSKSNKNTLDNFDFYDSKSKLFPTEYLSIIANNYNSDTLIFKNSHFKDSFKKNFYNACSYFYKNTQKAEELFYSVINDEKTNNDYKINSIILLMKLLNRKLDFKISEELSEKYQKICKLQPLYHIYKGEIYLERKDYLKSLSCFNKALKLKENNNLIIYNVSDLDRKTFKYITEIFFNAKRLKNAEKYLTLAQKSLQEDKSLELTLLDIKIKFLNNQYEEAFDLLSDAFLKNNIPIKLQKDYKSIAINLMLFVDYKPEFVNILSKDLFNKSEDILRIADTFYMGDSFVPALELYLLAVKRFGVDSKLLFKLGYISSKLRILEQACYYFEKFLEFEPDNLDALNNLAFLYLNLEKQEEAERTYLKILDLNNFSFEANLHLAILYMSMNNKEKAEKSLERAKTLNPVAPEIIKLYQIFKTEFN